MSFSNSSNSGGISWLWGIIISLGFHGLILLLVLSWGFGKSRYSQQPSIIEGRLVSISELSQSGGIQELKSSENSKEDASRQTSRLEPKQPKEPKEVVKEKEVQKETAREPEKEVAKEEEKPDENDVVSLDTKKKKEKLEKKVEKKVEKKPIPTKPSEKIVKKTISKKKEPEFEKVKSNVLEEMQERVVDEKRRNVIDELQSKNKGEGEKTLARADPSESSEGGIEGVNRKGGGISRGGPTSGVVTNLFLERIRDEIRRNYKIPPSIPTDGKLEAFIFFKMNEKGKVYDVRVNESSGNPAFDDLCVRAIYKSVPLTPPPPELIEQAKTVGFLIPFTNDPS